MIERDFLYSKKPVIIPDDGNRRSHSGNDEKKERMITLWIEKINLRFKLFQILLRPL